jgi:hypothetical protein
MSDTGSIRSASRASTLLNRPSIAPVGPRTRQSSLRISNVMGDDVTSPSESLTMDLPEFGAPNSEECTTAMSSSRVSSSLSNPKSLPALPEEPSSPESAPAYDDEELPVASTSQERPTSSVSVPAYDDEELPVASMSQERPTSFVSVPAYGDEELPVASTSEERPTSPVSVPAYDNEELPVASTSHERPASPVSAPAYDDEELPVVSTSQERSTSPVKVVPAALPPPTLVPPPAIKFEAITVPWKGLPLDVVLCKQLIPYLLAVHCLTS